MAKDNVNFEFRLKKTDETKNYLSGEIKPNALVSRKHKKNCTTLNYVAHLLILTCPVAGCFNFCICFISWHSRRYYNFCSRVNINLH